MQPDLRPTRPPMPAAAIYIAVTAALAWVLALMFAHWLHSLSLPWMLGLAGIIAGVKLMTWFIGLMSVSVIGWMVQRWPVLDRGRQRWMQAQREEDWDAA